MTYALNESGELVEATPHLEYLCPNCKKRVFSKCGEIRVWHWSHHISESCELSKIVDSVWRYNWIKKTDKKKAEKVINGYTVDVLGNNDSKIMFVGTKIDALEVINREKAFKDKLIWVLKSDDIKKLKIYTNDYRYKNKTGQYSFEWKNARKEWLSLSFKISFLFFDVGLEKKYYRYEDDDIEIGIVQNRLLYVKNFEIHDNIMIGRAVEMNEEFFIERYM